MKKIVNYAVICLFLVITCAVLPSFSQAKEDVITMKNGEKKTGKIASVTKTTVKFSYSHETAEYEIDKSDISKIDFASGRTETFDQASPATASAESNVPAPAVSAEQRKNKVAVLPFEIETNDQSLATPTMSKQVQESCINALRSQSPFQTIQDPMVTNNILTKKNLTAADLSMYTPKEWAEILGVEYVVIGAYSIQNKGTSTFGSGSASYNSKTNNDKTKGTAYSASNSYTTVNYDTHVNVAIYNDHGEQIFSDSKAPAFGGVDTYKGALKTLMKRSPFGRK
ncbi:CsgG/HfaB family protein [Chitinophaga sp. CC14]|uniref:CsgG/HfaB family protein n=1 Tax=Chitinophaga sp. CC14 TaxID=3029199 RepID=UPI003B7C13B3